MSDRILLHLPDDTYEAVDASDVYYFEAVRHNTQVRLRGRRRRTDVRQLGKFASKLVRKGFFRIHRSYLVNISRIRFVRRRKDEDGWEIRLEPPVNTVLPVSRERLRGLLRSMD